MDYVDKKTKDGKTVKVKDYKKKTRKRKIKKNIFLLILLLVALGCFLAFAPVFKVTDVVCEGNTVTSSKEIIKKAGIDFEKSIFLANTGKMEKEIEKIPYVDNCHVKRELPGTIKIKLEQSKAIGYIQKGKQYIYVDKDLKVLEVTKNKSKAVIPEFLSVNVKKSVSGENIETDSKRKYNYIKALVNELNKSKLRNKVTKIDFKDTENVKLQLGETFEILLGSDEKLDYKINFLAEKAYEQLGENVKGSLDVSSGTKGIYKEKKLNEEKEKKPETKEESKEEPKEKETKENTDKEKEE